MRSNRNNLQLNSQRNAWHVLPFCILVVLCLLGNGPLLAQAAPTPLNPTQASDDSSVTNEPATGDIVKERTTRIRLAFGNDEPQIWQGEIEFEGATPSKLRSLSLDPSSVGASWLEPNRLVIKHDRPLRQIAYDVTLTGPIDTKIVIRLSRTNGSNQTLSEPIVIPLQAVRQQAQTASIGDTGRLVVERMVGDKFHVSFANEKRIYSPGELFRCDVEPDTDALAPGDFFDFRVQLLRDREGEQIWQSELQRHDIPLKGLSNCPVEIPLPQEEGVYTVKLQVIRPAGFTSRFLAKGNSRALAERSFQLLVMNPNHHPQAPDNWQPTYTLDPTEPRSAGRLPDWAKWRKQNRKSLEPLSSTQTAGETHPTVGKFIALPPADETGAAHWQAYPLAVETPGAPYVVEVETKPGRTATQLGITLLDANQNGKLQPLGETIAYDLQPWGPTSENKKVVRFQFWPRTNSPLLVLSNPNRHKTSHFGTIRLLKPTGSVPSVRHDRSVAIHWQSPDLAKSVGASLASSPRKLYEYSDLQTAYESAQRIADRVQTAGANSAVVTINQDGATIVPLASLTGTPRYNMGTWALGMADIPPINTLEVLLQEFDRRDLRLIPTVSLAGPLPQLEQMFHQTDDTSIRWQSGSRHYNLLSPKVQQAVCEVGKELATAYGHHRSLDRLAIRLGAHSPLLSPNQEGGFDTATVDRFLQESQLNWPAQLPRSFDSHASTIRENVLPTWQKWKRSQAEAFYQRMTQAYSLRENNHCLVLPHELEQHPSLRDLIIPRLGKSNDLSTPINKLGLNTLASNAVPLNLALPKTTGQHSPAVANGQNLLAKAITPLQEPNTPQTWLINSANVSYPLQNASRLFTEKQEFIASGVVQNAGHTTTAIAAELTNGQLDMLIDSGSAAAGGMATSETQLRQLIVSTPIGNSSHQPNEQPALNDITLLKTEVTDGKAPGSILTATNRTPWPRFAHVTLKIPHRCLATPLVKSSDEPEWYEAGHHAMTIELAPYEALSWRFSTTGIETTGLRLTPVPEAEEQLRQQINRLKQADRTVRREYHKVANRSFEEQNDLGQPQAWTLSQPEQPLEKTLPAYEGEHALQLASTEQAASATSNPFAVPETGQFAVRFHAYPEQTTPDTKLKIEFLMANGRYTSQTTVSVNQLKKSKEAEQQSWSELIFAVDDLPLSPNEAMQIRFTLSGRGTILIDNLVCEDLMLPLPAYAKDLRAPKLALVQLIFSAEQALEEGRLADCQQTLDSYWARFLVTHFPQAKPVVAAVPKETSSDKDNAESTAEKAPSVSERLRGYWPKAWR